MPTVDSIRSGFLSQLFTGKPPFAQKPASLFSDFFLSVLIMADTSIDSHRVAELISKKKPFTDGTRITEFSSVEMLGMSSKDSSIESKKRSLLSGVILPFSYFKNLKPQEGRFFNVFSNVRTVLFGTGKLIDTFIRLPAIIFAALEFSFERVGWFLQSMPAMYLASPGRPTAESSFTKKILGFFADIILFPLTLVPAVIGFALNFTGAVIFRGALVVSKIVAESIRSPLAIMGGVVGAVYGAIVAFLSYVTGNKAGFDSWYGTIINSIADGIRPFAPEAGSYITLSYLKYKNTESPRFRRPFETIPEGTTNVIDVPWVSIALYAVCFTAMILLATVTMGFGIPFIPYLIHASGMEVHAFTQSGTLGSMFLKVALAGSLFIGAAGLHATLTNVYRGARAFVNDTAHFVQGITSRFNQWRTERALLGDSRTAEKKIKELENLAAGPAIVKQSSLSSLPGHAPDMSSSKSNPLYHSSSKSNILYLAPDAHEKGDPGPSTQENRLRKSPSTPSLGSKTSTTNIIKSPSVGSLQQDLVEKVYQDRNHKNNNDPTKIR